MPAAAAVQLAETFVDFDDIIENYDGERPSTIAYRRTKSKIRQYLRRSIAILSYRTICSGTHSVRAYDGSPIIKGHRRREYRVPGRHTSLRRLAYFPRNARPPPNFGTYSYCRNSRTIRGMGFRVSSPVTVFVPKRHFFLCSVRALLSLLPFGYTGRRTFRNRKENSAGPKRAKRRFFRDSRVRFGLSTDLPNSPRCDGFFFRSVPFFFIVFRITTE